MRLSWASRDINAGPLKEKQRRRGRHGGERRRKAGTGGAVGGARLPEAPVELLRVWPDTEHAQHHTTVCVCEPGVWSVCVSMCERVQYV